MFGKVKWFNNTKGFGFILPVEGGEEVFAHYSRISTTEKYKSLKAGQYVSFETFPGPNGGLHADNVAVVPDEEKPAELTFSNANRSRKNDRLASATEPVIPVRVKAKRKLDYTEAY